MALDPDTSSIGELAAMMKAAGPVLERRQIDYYCDGNRPVAAACAEAGISVEELFEEIAGSDASGECAPQVSTITALRQHIVETHHAFARKTLPTILTLAERVVARHETRDAAVLDVRALSLELAETLLPQMEQEEHILFPRWTAIDHAAPVHIRELLLEMHAGVTALLDRLFQVSGGYVLPYDACLSFRALYECLQHLDRDLRQHMLLERAALSGNLATALPGAIRRRSPESETHRGA